MILEETEPNLFVEILLILTNWQRPPDFYRNNLQFSKLFWAK